MKRMYGRICAPAQSVLFCVALCVVLSSPPPSLVACQPSSTRFVTFFLCINQLGFLAGAENDLQGLRKGEHTGRCPSSCGLPSSRGATCPLEEEKVLGPWARRGPTGWEAGTASCLRSSHPCLKARMQS